MRFAFTDDQRAFADGVRALLDDHCPPSTVRAAWDGDPAPADRLWSRLAEIGLLGVLVSERDGGFGLNELDLVLCLEQSGRAAVPLPLVESAVVAARLLAGSSQSSVLPALARGEFRASAVLDGSSLLPWIAGCDWGLVDHGGAVYLFPLAENGFEPVATVDRARPVARIDARPADALLVTDDPGRINAARRSGTLASAAQLIGLGERMLGMTVAYVKEREQFGVPIGSFQAVKHALADALLALELARPLVHAAAWAEVHDPANAARDVAAAKVRAGEAAGLVARTALQCHGGMGYTQEYDLHLWLKRTWALQASWGQPGELRALVGTALGIRGPGNGSANGPGNSEEK